MSDTYNIFLYWENKKGVSRAKYLDKCLETIKTHNKNVYVVTPKNITDFVPKSKINNKIWKLDLIAQRSDYFRFLLIHYNGGLWLDFDTICLKSFSELLSNLKEYDLLFHSEQFFAAKKGVFSSLIKEIEQNINSKITNVYLFKQFFKKIIYKLKIKNVNYKIAPFYWSELGLDVFKKHIKELSTYTVPEKLFQPKMKYNWEKDNNKKIYSETIKVNDFIRKKQLIVKMYNSAYKKEIINKLNTNDETLFNKLINYSFLKK